MNSRRDGILREMGLAPLWRLRSAQAVEQNAPEELVAEQIAAPAPEPRQAAPRPAVGRAEAPAVQPLARFMLPAVEGCAPVPRPQPAGDLASLGWDELDARIRECAACDLCKRRKRAVPGVGDRQADWLFVGEGPGAEEDERGEPFVGQAGRLLDAMLTTIDLRRGDDVFIGNAVKCRPPNNRTPETAELAACFPYLQRQIELLQPRLIVALGRPAAQALLNQEIKIAAARGKLFAYNGIPVIVTYHPAYLLRNQPDKAKAWEDLCFARATMRRLKHGA